MKIVEMQERHIRRPKDVTPWHPKELNLHQHSCENFRSSKKNELMHTCTKYNRNTLKCN